jgi:hypothetical protein
MWFMKSITIITGIPHERERVFGFLDVMAFHERFTDHMLRDWTTVGPARGVGARAFVTSVLGPKPDPIEIEVIDAVPGVRITERNVGAGGRRVAHGTYELEDLPPGGTRVSFTYEWKRAPLSERLLAPVARRIMRRAIGRALDRLADEIARADDVGGVAAAA